MSQSPQIFPHPSLKLRPWLPYSKCVSLKYRIPFEPPLRLDNLPFSSELKLHFPKICLIISVRFISGLFLLYLNSIHLIHFSAIPISLSGFSTLLLSLAFSIHNSEPYNTAGPPTPSNFLILSLNHVTKLKFSNFRNL